MPQALYARYVPPKKVVKEATGPRSPQSSGQAAAQSPLYARYVPPKKNQKPAERRSDDQDKPFDEAHEPGSKKGSKKRKRREDVDFPSDESLTISVTSFETAPEHADGSQSEAMVFGDMPSDDEQEDEATSILAKYSVTDGTAAPKRYQHTKGIDLVDKIVPEDYDPAAGAEAIFAKYRKSVTLSQKRASKAGAEKESDSVEEEAELHDLVPLPQPEKAPRVPYVANFSSLPEWISKPRVVSSDIRKPLDGFHLKTKIAASLAKRGLHDALAIQSEVLPLLLPGPAKYSGDICVSAPTGSGKTLAYVLPIVNALSEKALTRLKAIIVVPTRELVAQVKEVADLCAVGTGVKVGTAVGSVSLATEQEQLMQRHQRYDPVASAALTKTAGERLQLGHDIEDEHVAAVAELLPNHVYGYQSRVDVLICTPGRLVDHIKSTAGFTLQSVEWLVIDEADRLLDQGFQDWVDTVLPAVEANTTTARARLLSTYKERVALKELRKIILSATMTRDLSKLASLRLTRPTLVAVVEASTPDQAPGTDKPVPAPGAILPATLSETAVPVGDGSEKPLYALQLLTTRCSVSSDPLSTTLIFCSSDENANRLLFLLPLLSPKLADLTASLTRSSTASERRKTLANFGPGKKYRLLISTDRTSRGLDVEDLRHVLNYDIPPSVTSYVHRVGRTARAGKAGEAWTLYTDSEARWFWRTVARGSEIQRGERGVQKVRLSGAEEGLRERYMKALGELGEAVKGQPSAQSAA